MISVTETELRDNISKYLDAVEHGEEVEVRRHGKPVASLCPTNAANKAYWSSVTPLKLEGVSLSKIILEDRR